MTRIVIGMTGKRGSEATGYLQAQAGKDTAAKALVENHGFVRIALADGVRDSLYGLNPQVIIERSRFEGPVNARLASVVDQIGWDEAKKHPEIRALMQRMGTEAGCMVHGEDLWTRLVEHKMTSLDPHTGVVVTDVRFPNEAEWVHSLGGLIVEINRPQELDGDLGENAKHASETMGWITPDVVVINDGTIEQLHAHIDAIAQILGMSPKG